MAGVAVHVLEGRVDGRLLHVLGAVGVAGQAQRLELQRQLGRVLGVGVALGALARLHRRVGLFFSISSLALASLAERKASLGGFFAEPVLAEAAGREEGQKQQSAEGFLKTEFLHAPAQGVARQAQRTARPSAGCRRCA